MKVLVCGGRDFGDEAFVNRILTEQHRVIAFTHLIHGAAPGADRLAGSWARKHGVQEVSCPAQWDSFGKGAEPLSSAEVATVARTAAIAARALAEGAP